MKIESAKFLVTGGSRGIGREIARAIAARGGRLVLVGRNQSSLRETADELGSSAEIFSCDLGSHDKVSRLIAHCRDVHCDLAGLINNAAIQYELDLLRGDPAKTISLARQEIATNLDAVVSLSIGLLPLFREHEEAVIANITTGLAFAPKEASPVYCASKAACHVFTQTLRYQCQRSAPGISVLEAIMPLVDTDMTRGRGRSKVSAARAANAVVEAIETGRTEAWIGKASLLRFLRHAAPGIANRMLRGSGFGGNS